ncbi:MAG TPA: SAM-dependent methyltransferase [Candidatus Nanoarchaeia archaeon]|nr:SAM-dependent methyltransferase [Candidatus Nanoarchaeia archaeon]
MKAIIEHLEPELYEWCLLEYAHISFRLGKENIVFTNVPKKDHAKLSHLGNVEEKSVLALAQSLGSLCVLDPKEKQCLSPSDKGTFDFFVFGGILGDHPMKGRTEKHFAPLKALRRSLGNVQMSTDTAAIVCHKIIDGALPFSKLEFQDGIEIPLEEGFSNVFPYRYLLEDGKIVLTPGLIELLKKEMDESDSDF